MPTAIFVQPGWDGAVSKVELEGKLAEYQTLVKGYIQYLSTGDTAFIVDEDGIANQKPVNEQATSYLYTIAPENIGWNVLLGPVVIIGDTEDGEAADVPREALEYFELTD